VPQGLLLARTSFVRRMSSSAFQNKHITRWCGVGRRGNISHHVWFVAHMLSLVIVVKPPRAQRQEYSWFVAIISVVQTPRHHDVACIVFEMYPWTSPCMGVNMTSSRHEEGNQSVLSLHAGSPVWLAAGPYFAGFPRLSLSSPTVTELEPDMDAQPFEPGSCKRCD
jgi:hypothetical protein